MTCLCCRKPTSNPKFCNRKCAAIFNNSSKNGRKTGKQRIKVLCDVCGAPVKEDRRKYCSKCSGNLIKTSRGHMRISEATKADVLTNDTQRYARIRLNARRIAKRHGILNECSICGYSLYVECAHKKSIASYPDDALISVINSRKNLAGLCRNHHWEFDHNLISL